MARGSNDAMIGLLFAFAGIGLLLAWRTGALQALMAGGNLYTAATASEKKITTGIRGAADMLGNLGAPVTTRSPQGGSVVAQGGLPDDGVVSTARPMIADAYAAGGYRDESVRARRIGLAPNGPTLENIITNKLGFSRLPDSSSAIAYDSSSLGGGGIEIMA